MRLLFMTLSDNGIFIMAIVAVMFLFSGFLSLLSRQCADRRSRNEGRLDLALPTGGGSRRGSDSKESYGLNQEVMETFPTFLYSDVKGLKIGRGTLECPVCLNEFKDDETLRLIPKCSHVFHPACINVWLASRSTCPVCRASLVPLPEEDMPSLPPTSLAIQIPDDDHHHHHHDHEYQEQQPNKETIVGDDDQKKRNDVESEFRKVDLFHRSLTMNHNRPPPRSRSTGFMFAVLFPRSNSTGPSSVMVQPCENCERFTLRLPEEVRSQLLLNSRLKRRNSCVSFRRMRSGTRCYRTRSLGGGRGRSCLQYERLGSDQLQWGFTLTPPFFTRNSWTSRSASKLMSSPVQRSGVAVGDVVGERSSDLLCPG